MPYKANALPGAKSRANAESVPEAHVGFAVSPGQTCPQGSYIRRREPNPVVSQLLRDTPYPRKIKMRPVPDNPIMPNRVNIDLVAVND